MFEFNNIDKLDVIITLLVILIFFNLIKLILNFVISQMTGSAELTIINYSIDKGNFESALLRCQKQLSKAPKDSNFLWAQAIILYKLGRRDEAKLAFEQLAEDEPLLEKDAHIYIDSINQIQ